MSNELAKNFEPKSFEEALYKKWETSGYFTPDVDPNKEPFCIMMPPPNITGQLHMGHALTYTIQDIIIRHKRMLGYSALWLPGTDHASIATEVKIVDMLAKEGITKESLGREGFLKRAYEWKETYGGQIVRQLRRLGSSCDWTKEAFTMDKQCSKAVVEVFVRLYEKGLIYQGDRMINWCPSCLTALSDAEVEYENQQSHLWHIRYPYVDGSGYIVVATTRPETMLGDVAVAVNPNDKKYIDKIGKLLKLPLTDREIPVIADDYVESSFGTGAVKITPAHDPNDFEIGLRHDLEIVKVIADDGTMNENAFAYVNLSREEARDKIVKDLESLGYIEKIEDYEHNVGCCYRCHTTIEPIVSKQWFVSMEQLAQPAIEVVKDGSVSFIPERFSKIYFNWMENIKDWCISRQLWWGHRIPAWHCKDCGHITVSRQVPDKCEKCNSLNIYQDEDVLDTWFSSALWPFSTLGFPNQTKELEYFYPTNVLVTGYDIIFFWVARMIFSGIENMGKFPFSEVLIHGIVRDALGRKMSKSLGNGIDPIMLIEKYGADVLRFSLCMGVAPGADIRFSEDKMEPIRNFLNKLWNASRYTLMNIEGLDLPKLETFELSNIDKWMLNKLNEVSNELNKNLNSYDLGIASAKLYDFIWGEVCDWYIEFTKPTIYGENEELKLNTLAVLKFVMQQSLKLLHPFAPFITEEIWQKLGDSETIMNTNFPVFNKAFSFKKEHEQIEHLKEIIKAIRNLRAQMDVEPSRKVKLYVNTKSKDLIALNSTYIERLAGCSGIEFVDSSDELNDKFATIVTSVVQIYIPLGDLIDVAKEFERLDLEIGKLNKEIQRGKSMLSNQGFISKAPQHLVEVERKKLADNKDKLEKLLIRRAEL
ncbi:MAG: valine--tRNA ligase [Christensenellales bacterium]|jgi:valyl-tRNA synthetase|nr:valine--tRNA ligase [Clostridiales bacterium]